MLPHWWEKIKCYKFMNNKNYKLLLVKTRILKCKIVMGWILNKGCTSKTLYENVRACFPQGGLIFNGTAKY